MRRARAGRAALVWTGCLMLGLLGCGGSGGGGFLPVAPEATAVSALSFTRDAGGNLIGATVTLDPPGALVFELEAPGQAPQVIESSTSGTHQLNFGPLPPSGLVRFEVRPASFSGAAGLPLAGMVPADDPAAGATPQVIGLSGYGRPHPLIRDMTIHLDRPGDVEIEFWSADTPRLLVRGAGATSHPLELIRMEANSTYFYEITPKAPGGGAAGPTWTGTLTTGPLPFGLDQLQVQASGQFTHPIMWQTNMTNGQDTNDAGDRVFAGISLLNSRGRVVWFYQTDHTVPEGGGVSGFVRRPNGNWVLGILGVGLQEITPRGEVVASLPFVDPWRVHHEVIATASDTYLFLAFDTQDVGGQDITGEAIVEWDPDTGVATKRWSSFDHFTWGVDMGPLARPTDWLHSNSLDIGPRGNIVVSNMFWDQVISIAPDFGSIEWRIGGQNATVAIAPDAIFHGQHTARFLDDDTLLLFDNQRPPNEGVNRSRAIVLDISAANAGSGTVTKTWEFLPPSNNFTPIVGLTERLANGNTVVHFGVDAGGPLGALGPVETYEVTPGGTVVGVLRKTLGPLVVYRGTPVPQIGTEVLAP